MIIVIHETNSNFAEYFISILSLIDNEREQNYFIFLRNNLLFKCSNPPPLPSDMITYRDTPIYLSLVPHYSISKGKYGNSQSIEK